MNELRAAPQNEAGPAPEPPPRATGFPYDFPTEALLDDHVAQADELRADLDRLRRELNTGPPPLIPARKRSRKGLYGLLLAAVIAVAVGFLVPWSELFNGSPSSASNTGDADRNHQSGAPTPRSAPEGSLPKTGPGIDQPGTMMLVRVSSKGTLNVVEQARLGPNGPRDLSLRLPSMASLGGQVAQLSPTVHDLRVSVNGTAVRAVPTADGPGWAVTGTDPASTVQLSYQIKDAIVHTKPSSSGRALGVSLPLLGQALREQGLPLVVRAEGSVVGGATCPSAPVTEMLCGEQTAGGWLATIPADAASPTLLLQLTLTD